jgi:hypothetical protein
MKRAVRHLAWSAVIVSGLLCSAAASLAADQADPRETARAKLERLLSCQQAEKDAAFAEKRQAEAKIGDIETFIGSLSDRPVHVAARQKASRALAVARAALEKVEERLQLADRHVNLTLRAIQHLTVDQAGQGTGAVDEVKRRGLDWWAEGERYSRVVHGEFLRDYGFVDDPALERRLEGVLSRLQMMSPRPDVPIKVKVLARESGYGAAATATTVYFDKAYLDRAPSESELLFVAAHELAHVQLGHFSASLKKMETERKDDDRRYVIGREDPAVSSGGVRAEAADSVLEDQRKVRLAPFAQEQELQADLLGAQQALDAGASPKGIHAAMQWMLQERQAALARMNEFDRRNVAQRQFDMLAADHPEPEDRLHALEQAFGEKFWERTDLRSSLPCRHNNSTPS